MLQFTRRAAQLYPLPHLIIIIIPSSHSINAIKTATPETFSSSSPEQHLQTCSWFESTVRKAAAFKLASLH
jgi:hypothetical protein